MPNLRDIEGAEVRDARGRRYGRVEHLLFHPRAPRPIGLQVARAPMMYVIPRQTAFLPLSAVAISEGALALTGSAPSRGAGEKAIGAEWDETVIWRGMPVRAEAGTPLGVVCDVDVSIAKATVRSVMLTEGTLTDAALGKRSFPAEHVMGFDGEAVVIADEALAKRPEPAGLAATAGTGAAYAKVSAERLAAKAATAVVAGAKIAKRADIPRRTGKFLGSLRKTMLDAMRDDDEE